MMYNIKNKKRKKMLNLNLKQQICKMKNQKIALLFKLSKVQIVLIDKAVIKFRTIINNLQRNLRLMYKNVLKTMKKINVSLIITS